MNNPIPDVVEKSTDMLVAKTEQAIMEKLPVDQKSLERIAKLLDPKTMKRLGIGIVVGSMTASFLITLGKQQMTKAMISREVKKQIEPLKAQLEELESQNAALLKQNEELKSQMIANNSGNL